MDDSNTANTSSSNNSRSESTRGIKNKGNGKGKDKDSAQSSENVTGDISASPSKKGGISSNSSLRSAMRHSEKQKNIEKQEDAARLQLVDGATMCGLAKNIFDLICNNKDITHLGRPCYPLH